MAITRETSRRIDIIKFPLIAMVVMIHAKVSPDIYTDTSFSTVAAFIQYLFSNVIALCAVPLFFAISGYLFFSRYDFSRRGYVKLFRKRVTSLLVPYFIFNILTLAVFYLFQQLPQTAPLFNTPLRVADYNCRQYIAALTGIGGPSAAYHLWFIKHLFLMTVYSPLLWLLLKKVPLIGLLAMLICYIGDFSFGWFIITPKSLFFFYFGGYLAVRNIRIAWCDGSTVIVTGVYVGVAIGYAAMLVSRIAIPLIGEAVIIIFGMVAVWTLVGRIAADSPFSNIAGALLPYALFVYLAHQPLLNLIQKLLIRVMTPLDGGRALAVYLLSFLLTMGICLCVGHLLRRHVPRLYAVLVGGRG